MADHMIGASREGAPRNPTESGATTQTTSVVLARFLPFAASGSVLVPQMLVAQPLPTELVQRAKKYTAYAGASEHRVNITTDPTNHNSFIIHAKNPENKRWQIISEPLIVNPTMSAENILREFLSIVESPTFLPTAPASAPELRLPVAPLGAQQSPGTTNDIDTTNTPPRPHAQQRSGPEREPAIDSFSGEETAIDFARNNPRKVMEMVTAIPPEFQPQAVGAALATLAFERQSAVGNETTAAHAAHEIIREHYAKIAEALNPLQRRKLADYLRQHETDMNSAAIFIETYQRLPSAPSSSPQP